MNNNDKRKIEEIMKTTGQGAVNKIVKGEKKKISKLKEDIEKESDIYVKKYLMNNPNPQQKRIDKIIESEKQNQDNER